MKNFGMDRKGLATRNKNVKYESLISFASKVMANVKFFSKVGQKSRSRSRSQKFWYLQKGLVTRNTLV